MDKDRAACAAVSLAHFTVDFSCAVVMAHVTAGSSSAGQALTAVLLYNACAFAAQLPLGIALDMTRAGWHAGAGCALTALTFAAGAAWPVQCVSAGLGNAVFHAAAGSAVLASCSKKGSRAALGVFVAAGAPGIFLGGLASVPLWASAAAGLGALACRFAARTGFFSKSRALSDSSGTPAVPSARALTGAALLCAAVAARGWIGMSLNYVYKAGFAGGLSFCLCVSLGKALGGIMADRAGEAGSCLVCLGTACALFAFSFESPAAGFGAACLFNAAMPLSLAGIGRVFGGAPGLAFGLASFSLFAGSVPVLLTGSSPFFGPAALPAGSALTAGVLLLGLKLARAPGRRVS